jgi:hypothetical protein
MPSISYPVGRLSGERSPHWGVDGPAGLADGLQQHEYVLKRIELGKLPLLPA